MLILIGSPVAVGLEPSVGDMLQRPSVEVVELVAALPAGDDQAGGLQHVEVLGDRLAGGGEPMLHGQPRADLEQGLVVTVGQLVEDLPAGGVGQGVVHVTHDGEYMQAATCLSTWRGKYPGTGAEHCCL
jgi:hypothetical protein